MESKSFRNFLGSYIGTSAALIALLISMAGCSPGFQAASQPASTAAASPTASTALAIDPTSVTIGTGSQMQFNASGGTSPYKFTVNSSNGAIDSSSGLFLSGSQDGTVTVTLTDAAGSVVTATVTISSAISNTTSGSGGLTVSYSPDPVRTGNVVTIAASGGTAPYTFKLISGNGTLSSNSYTTTSSAETGVQILVSDSASPANTVTVNFDVASAASANIPSTAVTSVSAVAPDSYTGESSCPSGTTNVGGVSFFYGKAEDRYGGTEVFCEATDSMSSATSVIADLYLTPGGAHLKTPSCPSGYNPVAVTNDCEGGACYGYQYLCGLSQDPTAATTFVTDFYITGQGSHSASAPGCQSGYKSIGTTADCSGGNCSGLQTFCVAH